MSQTKSTRRSFGDSACDRQHPDAARWAAQMSRGAKASPRGAAGVNRRKFDIEWLEERQMLAAAVTVGPRVAAAAGLVNTLIDLLPPDAQNVIDAIPSVFRNLLDAVDSSFVYQAFPGETNNVEIQGDLANLFLLANEDSDVTLLRLGAFGATPPFSKDLVETLLDAITFSTGVDIGASIGIAIANGEGGTKLDVNFMVSPLLPIKNAISLTDARAIAVNPSALLDFIPSLGFITDAIDSVLNFDISSILPRVEVPPIRFPGLPADDIDFGLFTIDAGSIIPEFDLIPGVDVDIISFLNDLNIPTSIVDIIDVLPGPIQEIVNTLTTVVDFFKNDLVSDDVFVSTLDGNDTIDLDSLTGVPEQIHAGPGNDEIRGGGSQPFLNVLLNSFNVPIANLFSDPAAIELFGEEGDDTIVVHRVFNVLDYRVDGGPGNDRLLVEGTDRNDIIELFARPDGTLDSINIKRPDPNGGAATNERQSVTLPAGTTGGTFTLTFVNLAGIADTTGPINFDAPATGPGSVQEALESLSNIDPGDVSVTKPSPGRWTIEFTGALGNSDQRFLFADGSGLARSGAAVSVFRTAPGDPDQGTNQIQKIALPTLSGVPYITGGSFVLRFGADTTAAIPANASASEIESALVALPSLGAGDVNVTGVRGGPWFLEFTGNRALADQPLIVGDNVTNLTGGITGTVAETTMASPRELTITLPAPRPGNAALGGSFTLSYNNGTVSDTTVALPADATAAAIQSALTNLASIGAGNVSVTGPAGGPWNVSLSGTPAAAGQPLITASAANLSGGATLDVSTPLPGSPIFSEIQLVTISGATGGTFRLTFNNGTFARTTEPLAFDATAGEIEAELNMLTSISSVGGSVIVTGPVAGPWFVEFAGSLALSDQLPLVIDGTSLRGGFVDSDIMVVQTNAPVNERQTITLSPLPAGGTFTLSFAGQTTGPINFNASAGSVQGALSALPAIGMGNVSVTGGPGSYVVQFTGNRSGKNVPSLMIDTTNLSRGLPITVTVEQNGAPQNEIQTVTLPPQVTGGDFTLTFKSVRVTQQTKGTAGTNEVQRIELPPGTTGGTFTLGFKGATTGPIAFDASGLQVQAALRSLGTIAGANVNVTGGIGGPWLAEFTGSLGNADQPFLQSSAANLTGPFTTSPIAFNASAAQVQSALASLPSIGGAANLNVTSPNATGGPWAVEFRGTLAATPLELVAANGAGLNLVGGALPTVEQTRQGGNGQDVLLATTQFTSLVSVEQLVIEGGGGDDRLIVHGAPTFPLGIFFDAGAGTDFLDLFSNDATPEFVAPTFPDDTAARLLMDSQPITFSDVEGGVKFDASGGPGQVLLSGTEAGNEIRFAGTGSGAATFANDSQVTITLDHFGPASGVTILSLQGDDTLSIAPNGVAEFTHFTLDGGAPTGAGGGAAGADSIRFEGTTGVDRWTYSPSGLVGDAGQNIYDLGGGNLVTIDFRGIDEVGFVGLAGIDSLTVREPGPGSTDSVFYSPTVGHGGEFDYTIGAGRALLAASVAFDSVETVNFDTGTGRDEFHITSDELPDINLAISIVGGNGTATVVLADEQVTYTHDLADEDRLLLELGTHRSDVDLSPGVGLGINVDLGFGRSLTFNGIDADVTADIVNGTISQPGVSDVFYTGVESLTYVAGAPANALTIETAGLGAPIVYRPRGATAGEFSSDGADPAFDFAGFAGAFTINGGPDIDNEVAVLGASTRDTFTVSALARRVTVANAAGVALKPVLLGTGIELISIDSGAGDDTILVQPDPGIGEPFEIHVDAGPPNASDRIVVQDQGPGNTIQHFQAPDERSGSVIVGALPPVVYQNVERVDILPLDPVTGGTGADGAGRIVVFHPDTFEHNESRLNPTELPDLAEHTAKPNINPGAATNPFGLGFDLPGDEDWYRFIATETSTFRFEVLFSAVGTLTNGNAGLPGDGLLRIDMYEANGTPIVRLPSETDPAKQTIGVENGRTYFLRVRGQTPPAINIYDINVVDLDTLGPQVFDPDNGGPAHAIQITSNPTYDIFAPKPTAGPTPLVTSLTINIRDLPTRFPGFLYGALDTAISSNPGHYLLTGDQNGIVPISQVIIINNPVVPGFVATATIELRFTSPLPDDRYTLSLSDSIVDPNGNKLDGESNAREPQANPLFPTGDGVSGGDFVARFTVDSRPEVGTFCCGSWYIDLNGNGSFDDPNNHDSDATNGDVVYKFGVPGDFPVVGDWDGNGYDEIGVYGLRAGPAGTGFYFELDLNGNGALDNVGLPGGDARFRFGTGGRPVAGHWTCPAGQAPCPRDDHVAVFNNTTWVVDLGTGAYTPASAIVTGTSFVTTVRGRPFAADFNGDGDDDAGLFRLGVFTLDFASDDDFQVDTSINFGFGTSTTQQIAVAGDWDADGDGNVGLFVQDRNGVVPREAAEFYLDLGVPFTGPLSKELCDVACAALGLPALAADAPANPSDGLFQPPPTGGLPALAALPRVFQDIFAQFGDELAEPIVGNFDPPAPRSAGAILGAVPTIVRPDHANSIGAAATPLFIWDGGNDASEFGSIESSRDRDVFRLAPAESGRIAIAARRNDSSLDANLTIFSSAGRRVARNDNFGGSPDSRVELDVAAGQTYYIMVGGSRRTTGAYDVLVDYLLSALAGDPGNSAVAGTAHASLAGVVRARDTIGQLGRPTDSNISVVTRGLDAMSGMLDASNRLIASHDSATGSIGDGWAALDAHAGRLRSGRVRANGGQHRDFAAVLDWLLASAL